MHYLLFDLVRDMFPEKGYGLKVSWDVFKDLGAAVK